MPESITLERLHELIQIAFGWTDSHLHVFGIDGQESGPDGDWADTWPEDVRLSSLVAVGERFHYVYDFGDNWRHTTSRSRKRLSADSGDVGVRCIGGRRAGPPENCGGIDAYQELLALIADSESADEDLLSWAAWALGTTNTQLRRHDPARFDQTGINAALLNVLT